MGLKSRSEMRRDMRAAFPHFSDMKISLASILIALSITAQAEPAPLFDGKTFDPANPKAYLDSLAIKAMV